MSYDTMSSEIFLLRVLCLFPSGCIVCAISALHLPTETIDFGPQHCFVRFIYLLHACLGHLTAIENSTYRNKIMFVAIRLWRTCKPFQFLTINNPKTVFYTLPSVQMADFLGQWSSKWVPRPAALALPGNMMGMQFLGSYHNGIGNSGEGTERSVLKCPAHDSASH